MVLSRKNRELRQLAMIPCWFFPVWAGDSACMGKEAGVSERRICPNPSTFTHSPGDVG